VKAAEFSLLKKFLELRWFQEILVFTTVFILFTLSEWRDISKWNDLWRTVCYFMILYAHAQMHRFLVLPLLLDRHKPWQYALFTVLLLLLFATVLNLLGTSLLFPDCNLGPNAFVYYIGACGMSLIAILTPFLVLRFYRQQKYQTNSQLCMKEMELNLLRSQLNPHFLFNTFNNLYGISLQEPARVPDLILQMSQLMRYQLDSNSKIWVTMEEELLFIESYIALEEERVGKRCEVHYEFTNTSGTSQFQIAPMMLIPFIENAFKHGTDCIEPCFVNIRIRLQEGGWLEMEIVNSIPKKAEGKAISTGIGLENARQRLGILYPGKKHRLHIQLVEREYRTTLALQLNPKGDDRKIPLSDCR